MSRGTIKKLVSERGFGFITAEDGKDYFFHQPASSRRLTSTASEVGRQLPSRSRRATKVPAPSGYAPPSLSGGRRVDAAVVRGPIYFRPRADRTLAFPPLQTGGSVRWSCRFGFGEGTLGFL